MLGIGSLISPKVGIGVVKSALEKTLKQKFENFDMIYKRKAKTIDFCLYDYKTPEGKIIDKHLVKYTDGDKLCSIIETLLSEKVDTKSNDIDFVVVNYKAMTLLLFITKDGEKIKKLMNL